MATLKLERTIYGYKLLVFMNQSAQIATRTTNIIYLENVVQQDIQEVTRIKFKKKYDSANPAMESLVTPTKFHNYFICNNSSRFNLRS